MIDCQKLPELAPDYHSNGLSLKERSDYQEHLTICEPCRQEDEEYLEALDLLKPWPVHGASQSDEDFLANLSLKLELAPKQVVLTRRPRILAIAASILLLLSVFSWNMRSNQLTTQHHELAFLEENLEWEDLQETSDSLDEEESHFELADLEDGMWIELEENWPESTVSSYSLINELSLQDWENLLAEFEEV